VHWLAGRDFTFFQYYCLTKLGRTEETRAKLAQFRAAASRLLTAARGAAANAPLPAAGEEAKEDTDLLGARLMRDGYVAEVFLSLIAPEEGRLFFRKALAAAKSDDERLGPALMLSQLLLLEKKHAEYAELVTETLRPLLL